MPVFESGIVSLACAALIAFYAALFVSAWVHGGTLFGSRDTVNQDFSVFWGAGRLATAGKAASAYDWDHLRRLLESSFGKPSIEVGKTFNYPPVFLMILAPLGLLPHAAAAAIWLGGTLAAYLAAVHAILPGRTALLAALAAPAVLFNFIAGQNGLLTAALLGGALLLIDTRPLIAGALIGMLSYKPQFGILLPFLLAYSGRWRVFAAAAATVVALFAAAAAAFGTATFETFLSTAAGFFSGFSQHGHLQWDRLASPYALLRATGFGAAAAWAVQAAIAGGAIAASLAVANSRRSDALKAATVAVSAMLIAPYSELTDLALLTVAMAYLVRDCLSRGFHRCDVAALAVAFLLPLALVIVRPLRQLAGVDNVAALVGPAMCSVLAAMIGWRLAPTPGAPGEGE